jgi:hypothetical protein
VIDRKACFLTLLARAAVLSAVPGPAGHLETFGQPNGGVRRPSPNEEFLAQGRFRLRELRVSRTFLDKSRPQLLRPWITQLDALPALPALVRDVSDCVNSANLDISRHLRVICSVRGYPAQRPASTSCPRPGRIWLRELRESRHFVACNACQTDPIPGRRTRCRVWRMASGECHMMIGLCEVNLGGCHERESSDGPGAPPRPVDSHEETPYREFASSLTNRFEPTRTPQDRAGVCLAAACCEKAP